MGDVVGDGYTLVAGALSEDTTAVLRERIACAIRERVDGVEVRAGTEWIHDATVLGPTVAELASPTVIAELARLLGPRPARLSAVMRNPVGETAQQALHADWGGPIHPGSDQQAQVIFYLDAVDAGNGPTRVVPASHRSGRTPPQKTGDPRAAHPDQVLITASAGDALVFSSHLWHGGTANRSGRPRRAITITYRRSG